MSARFLPALPGAALAGVAAWLIGAFLGGAGPAALAAATALSAGLALGMLAPTPRDGLGHQLVLASLLLVLLGASLFTFGGDRSSAPVPTGAILSLGFLGSLACGFAALRLRQDAHAAELNAPLPADLEEDPDVTLELQEAEDSRAGTVAGTSAASATLAMRMPMLLAAGLGGLLLLTAIYWTAGAPRDPSVPSFARAPGAPAPAVASAADLPSTTTPVAPAPLGGFTLATASLQPADADDSGDAAEIEEPAPQPAAGSNAVEASAARRECMAQIEAAHLFRQIASQSENEASYALATEPQIARFLRERPVGPRTLARIADNMWEQRQAPPRDTGWWSTQYRRCENTRIGGAWYVVKG